MKCKVCGNKTDKSYNIRNGKICDSCYNKLPLSIQHDLHHLTSDQIRAFIASIPAVHENPWVIAKNVELTDSYITINNIKYGYDNIEYIYVKFHPEEVLADTFASGYISIVMTLKAPHILISEEVLGNVGVKYMISNRNIRYSAKEISRYQQITNSLNDYIHDQISLMEFKAVFEKTQGQKQKDAQRDSQNKRQESAGNNQNTYHQSQANGSGQSQRRRRSGGMSKETALTIMQIKEPFTAEELKKKRNELIKVCHPDNGGSKEASEKLMEAYDLLSRIAS